MIDQLKKQLESRDFSFKKIVALSIIVIITLVFVFFGMMGKQNALGGGSGYAARVNKNIISIGELNFEATRLEQMYAPMFGGNMTSDMRERLMFQALENLINTEVIQQGSEKAGVQVSDEEIRDFVVNDMPAFKKDGRFSREMYQRVLEANNYSPSDFEQRIRKDKIQNKTRTLIESVAYQNALETQKESVLAEKQMNVAFVKWNREDLAKSYADNNKVDSKLLEDKLAKDFSSEDGKKKISEYYQSHQAEFVQEEKVKASHILVKVDSKNPDSEKSALEKIRKIQERLKKEDFGKVASEVSEDKGSAAKKGDLDYFNRGQMVPEFDQAAFSQAVGVVGPVVKSQFGFHIIKVTDKKPKSEVTLEKATTVIAKRLIAEDLLEQDSKSLEDALSKNDLATAESLVKKMGLKWEDTGYFGMEVDSIPKLNFPTLTAAVFELTKEKPLLNRFVREGNEKYILRLLDIKKAVALDSKDLKESAAGASKKGLNFAKNLNAPNKSESKSYQYFSEWAESVKSKSDVEKNMELFKFTKQ